MYLVYNAKVGKTISPQTHNKAAGFFVMKQKNEKIISK
jgi:hypothetical protein